MIMLNLQKREYLSDNHLENLTYSSLCPDNKNNWLNITDNDWENLISHNK